MGEAPRRPPSLLPSVIAPSAIAVAGALVAIASRLGGPLVRFNPALISLTLLAAGVALVAAGVVMAMTKRDRFRGFAATAALTIAVVPMGLAVHAWKLASASPGLGVVLTAAGSAVAVAGSVAVLAGRVALPARPDATTFAAGGGAALAVIGTFLPWFSAAGVSESGLGIPPRTGILTLGFGLVSCAAVGGGAFMRSERNRAASAAVGAAAAGVVAVIATHVGVLLEEAGGFGVLLVVLGSVVALAAGATGLLTGMGLPKPDPAKWVSVVFLVFGVLGLVLSFGMEERLEDLGANLSVMRISSMLLFATGGAMAFGQTWGWILAFPVAIAGVLNGIVVVIQSGNRGFGLLAVLIYANALRALWQGGGSLPGETAADTGGVPPPRPDLLPAPLAPVAPPEPTQPFGGPPGAVRPPAPPPPAPGLGPRSAPGLALSLEELSERRTWQSDPVLQQVLDPLNRREYGAAAAAAEALETRFLDLDLLYSWWGKALLEQGDAAGAREVLRRGIARSRRKYLLAERLGEVAWKSGDFEDAVAWWGRSVRSQEASGARGEVGPYLYLHSVALGMGMEDVAGSLLDRVDRMRPGQIRLEEPVAAELRRLAASRGGPEVSTMLRELTASQAVPPVPGTSGLLPATPAPAAPSAAPEPVPAATPGPERWDGRRIAIVTALGVLLLGGGMTLGAVLSGDDDALPAAERPPAESVPTFDGEPVPDGSQDVLGQTVDCLAGRGYAPGAPIGAQGGRAVVFTTDDGTTVTVIEFPTHEDAMAAHQEAVERVTPGEGYIYAAGRIVMLFAPAPTDALRTSIESCVPLF